MLTTCPECHTCFRVSQAQLDHRRGLVRCGRCSAVFNAYDTLLPELTTPAREEAVSTPAVSTPAETVPPDTAVPDQTRSEARPPLPPDGDRTAATYASEGDRFLAARRRTPAETTTAHAATAGSAIESPAVAPEGAPSLSETSDDILLSALPTARKRTLPSWSSALWMLASLLLTSTFLLQSAYFLRAEIAAAWPEARPVLEQACRTLGCKLPLHRDLSALRFDASSLETDPEDGSRAILRLSLSNRSDRVVAWPHLILILTDVRDMPVAQRPFPPSDYLLDAGLEARGMATGEEREIRLDLELKGLSAYGYKLDKQYP